MRNKKWTDAVLSCTDFETSHFDQKKARICEWAVIPIFKGRVLETQVYVEQLNPCVPIDYRATRLHGLANRHVNQCQPLSSFIDELWMIFGEVVIAHGAHFEAGCFKREMPNFPLPLVLDTQKWARKLHKGEKSKLEVMVEKYDLDSKIKMHPKGRERKPHRAYYDASAAALLFIEFARRLDSTLGRTATLGEIANLCEYKFDE